MKKIILIVFLVVFFAILGFALFFNIFLKKNNVDLGIAKNDIGIEVFSPKAGSVISSPLEIEGKTFGNGWIGFEAQVGVVRLFDDKGNELALGLLTAQGEWMQKEINLKTELNFTAPETINGTLVFYNENPSGEPIRDKTFVMPIKFK